MLVLYSLRSLNSQQLFVNMRVSLTVWEHLTAKSAIDGKCQCCTRLHGYAFSAGFCLTLAIMIYITQLFGGCQLLDRLVKYLQGTAFLLLV